mgnify:FL=1
MAILYSIIMKLEYRYPLASLSTGSSLGNCYAFARLDEATHLRGLWSAESNQFMLGSWDVELFVDGTPLGPVETVFRPESQATRLQHHAAEAERLFFLPFILEPRPKEKRKLSVAFYLIRLTNTSEHRTTFLVRHTLVVPAVPCPKFTKQPPVEQCAKRARCVQRTVDVEITTLDRPEEVRVFSATIEPSQMKSDQRSLIVEYSFALSLGETLQVPFAFAFSSEGSSAAYETLREVSDARALLQRSMDEYDRLLSRTWLFSPHASINRGLQWAKVNMVRAQHRYRLGEGFTNDPPQDIVVIRDLAWYVLGSDYVTPAFSHALLRLAEQWALHPDGKCTEYLHADEMPPALHDYRLNINDDTPLFIWAAFHHALTCCEGTDHSDHPLRRLYPVMKRAGEYILTQIHDGLVRCTAEGTGVWGICGWRNIIDGYTLNGAVTEVNAECAFALRVLADAAEHLGFDEEVTRYAQAAEALRNAINTQLRSERTGMYLLNIDTRGVCHHDVTGDLIFPVMFDIAEDQTRTHILKRLLSEEFWTPYGTRTVSPREANYDPDFGYQLVGGVWHNLTAWIAYAVRKQMPEKLVEALLNTYRLSECTRPKDFGNVVPGQFPERLHGASFISRGMTMSPWMPPTYVWLVAEGLLGVQPSLSHLEISPSLPATWKWVAVKDVPYRGEMISAFLYAGTLYCTKEVRSTFNVVVGKPASCKTSSDHLFALAMVDDQALRVFMAADQDVSGIVTAQVDGQNVIREARLCAGDAQLMEIPLELLQPVASSSNSSISLQ